MMIGPSRRSDLVAAGIAVTVAVVGCVVGWQYAAQDMLAFVRPMSAALSSCEVLGPLGAVAVVGGIITALLAVCYARVPASSWWQTAMGTLAAFAWGFAPAAMLAFVGDPWLANPVARFLGADEFVVHGNAFFAPIVEEPCKAVGVLLLLCMLPKMRSWQGGILLGISCGLGFQLVEDLIFVARSGLQHPLSDMLGAHQTAIVRACTAVWSHWLFTGIAGCAIALLFIRGQVPEATERDTADSPQLSKLAMLRDRLVAAVASLVRSHPRCFAVMLYAAALLAHGGLNYLASIFHDGPVWGWSAPVASRLF